MTQVRDLLEKDTVDTLYALKRRMQRSTRTATKKVHDASIVER